MKLLKIFMILGLFAAVGGFLYLSMTDINIEKRPVTQTIPNERFFDKNS